MRFCAAENEMYHIGGWWLCGSVGDEILLIFTFVFIVGARKSLQFSHSVHAHRTLTPNHWFCPFSLFLSLLFIFSFRSFEYELLPLCLYEFVFTTIKHQKLR